MEKQLEHALRIEIKEQLTLITKANSPHIWNAIHTPKGTLNVPGYMRIEKRIISKIISGQLTPSAAIPQIEQEMDLL